MNQCICSFFLIGVALFVAFLAPLTPRIVSLSHLPLSTNGCDSRFGSVLGISHGVIAYSNCNEHTISQTASYLLPQEVFATEGSEALHDVAFPQGEETVLYSGMQWQCVEYARRFLMSSFHSRRAAREGERLTFGDVDGAEDIWSSMPFETISLPSADTKKGNVVKKSRNATRWTRHSPTDEGNFSAPQIGDLVIWSRQEGMPYGHVAVIVSSPIQTEEGSKWIVQIAEQNFASHVWTNHTFSRTLGWERQELGWSLVDTFGYNILGWIRP